MLTVHCPEHGTDVLLTERRIEEIVALPDRHLVRWRCWCGATGATSVERRRPVQLVGRHRPAV